MEPTYGIAFYMTAVFFWGMTGLIVIGIIYSLLQLFGFASSDVPSTNLGSVEVTGVAMAAAGEPANAANANAKTRASKRNRAA
ncbi:hypothetical protein ACKTEK_11550 [Tepidamorphus sp. 3E244]|uniref:hypothetical protein n=1 Tax=Tepidamorphus sp. 3E244 TaxID=3385498 RepID=UPI0038FC2C8A